MMWMLIGIDNVASLQHARTLRASEFGTPRYMFAHNPPSATWHRTIPCSSATAIVMTALVFVSYFQNQLSDFFSMRAVGDVAPRSLLWMYLDETDAPLRLPRVSCSARLVQTITLLANTRANDYIGVNMYVDGTTSKASLPENCRASELCRLCGHSQAQVRGDVFVARVFDDDDGFERLDFHLSDVSASAPWVAMAAQQRIGRLREPAQTILARIRAYCVEKDAGKDSSGKLAVAARRDPTPAEELQEQADAAFKAHNHAAAVELFGRCAAAAGPAEERLRLAALSHRALSHLKLRHPEAALADCEAVLARQPHNTAALYRKAAAYRALGRRDDACLLLRLCLELQPHNLVARGALEKLEPRVA